MSDHGVVSMTGYIAMMFSGGCVIGKLGEGFL